jgi:hypothetical protein
MSEGGVIQAPTLLCAEGGLDWLAVDQMERLRRLSQRRAGSPGSDTKGP